MFPGVCRMSCRKLGRLGNSLRKNKGLEASHLTEIRDRDYQLEQKKELIGHLQQKLNTAQKGGICHPG